MTFVLVTSTVTLVFERQRLLRLLLDQLRLSKLLDRYCPNSTRSNRRRDPARRAPVTVTADAPPPITVTAPDPDPDPDPDPSTTTVIPPAIILTLQVPNNAITSTQASATVTCSVSAYVQSYPSPSEVFSSEVTNNTVHANDPRIAFMGNWTDSHSCDGMSKKTTTPGSSMTFQFIGASS